jgi:Ni/Fe-hydrogenase 1 B-type cytochrome subunit
MTQKKWSGSFRIWHWLNAVVLLGIFGTLLLRETFLNYKENAKIIGAKLSSFGIAIADDQAREVAKALRAPMWEWHIYLGYALAFLLLWRITLFFTQSGKQSYRFADLDMHHKAVSVGYIVVYAALFFMVISGVTMHLHESFGISDTTAHGIKEFHETVANIILFFVPLHIAGVVVAEMRGEKNIVSNMIHGTPSS